MNTLSYDVRSPIVFTYRIKSGKYDQKFHIDIYPKGTFTWAVSDGNKYEEGLIPDSLIRKTFEAHFILPAYEIGETLDEPEKLKEHAPEILAAIRESSREIMSMSGMEFTDMTIDEIEIGPGDRNMIKAMKNSLARAQEYPSPGYNGAAAMPGVRAFPASPEVSDPASAAASPPASRAEKAPGSWVCSCGRENTGRFCTECGSPRDWLCECGHTNSGKFCTECGRKRK